MKLIAILFLVVFFSPTAWAAKDTEIDSPNQIQSFLSDPRVHDFHYPDPKNWKNFKKYIQIGTILPSGACQFHDESSISSNEPTLKIEIAVDRAGCRSLVIEGTPDAKTWGKFQQYEEYVHKNSAQTKLKTPIQRRSMTIERNSTNDVPQLQLNEDTSSEHSATTNSLETTSTGGNFNVGGTTYVPVYDIQYTDANNSLIQSVLGDILESIAGLFGAKVGTNGILAAEVSISQDYGTPTVSPISGNCYYDNQSNGSSVNFTQYGGDVVYRSGSVGWTQTSENACDSMLFSTGATIGNISTSSTTPGQPLNTPATSACIANSKTSFSNSCSQYGQQIPYVAFGYYTNASGSFFNNSNVPAVFDCSAGGLTINFTNMQIVSDGAGHSNISGDSDYSGPTTNCSNNLSRIVINNPTASTSTE